MIPIIYLLNTLYNDILTHIRRLIFVRELAFLVIFAVFVRLCMRSQRLNGDFSIEDNTCKNEYFKILNIQTYEEKHELFGVMFKILNFLLLQKIWV